MILLCWCVARYSSWSASVSETIDSEFDFGSNTEDFRKLVFTVPCLVFSIMNSLKTKLESSLAESLAKSFNFFFVCSRKAVIVQGFLSFYRIKYPPSHTTLKTRVTLTNWIIFNASSFCRYKIIKYLPQSEVKDKMSRNINPLFCVNQSNSGKIHVMRARVLYGMLHCITSC